MVAGVTGAGIGGKSVSAKGSNAGGGQGMGGAQRGGVGGMGSGGKISKGTGPAGGKSLGNATSGIGSANAAIGTYSRAPEAQEAAYGGMLDAGFGAQLADQLISALPFISRTTKVNPVSGFTESNYTGGLLDGIGSILGGKFGGGLIGTQLDRALGTQIGLGTHTYGEGWGGQTLGGGGFLGGGAPAGTSGAAASPQLGSSTGGAGFSNPMARAVAGPAGGAQGSGRGLAMALRGR